MSSPLSDPGTARASGVSSAGQQSVGEIVGQVTSDMSTLMRQELELAKVELKQEVSKAGKSAGFLGGAGAAGYFALLFLSLALTFLLARVMPLDLAAFLVAVLYGIVGVVLYGRGRQGMKKVNPTPTQTVESLKEDVQWAKARKS